MRIFAAILLLLSATATAFTPAPRNGRTSVTALSGSPSDLLGGLANALKNPKQAITQALAGEYDREATKAKLDGLISETPLLMLSFQTCPFCLKAKQVLAEKGVTPTVLELDALPDGKALRAEMAASFTDGRTSVPAIWIKGEYIGGCNDGGKGGLLTLNNTGELDPLLKSAGVM